VITQPLTSVLGVGSPLDILSMSTAPRHTQYVDPSSHTQYVDPPRHTIVCDQIGDLAIFWLAVWSGKGLLGGTGRGGGGVEKSKILNFLETALFHFQVPKHIIYRYISSDKHIPATDLCFSNLSRPAGLRPKLRGPGRPPCGPAIFGLSKLESMRFGGFW